MSDVVKKIKDSTNIEQGNAIVFTNKFGSYQKVAPENNEQPNLAATSGRLTNRFDDQTYYSA